MRFNYHWLLLILFFCSVINAQTFTLRGTVLDRHDGGPLSGAVLTVTPGNHKTTTDAAGQYEFAKLPSGKIQVVITHPDCSPAKEQLNLRSDLVKDFELEHHEAELEEIAIHGVSKPGSNTAATHIDSREIQQSSGKNLGNLLEEKSGLAALKTGNNIVKPVIHGFYGSRVTIMSNDVRLNDQEWGSEHAPNVEISDFEHIDVIKGASTLRYGADAIGGVVVLRPEYFPKRDTIKGFLQSFYTTNGRSMGLNVGVTQTFQNGWYVSARGSYTKSGDLSTPNYNLYNTGQEAKKLAFFTGKDGLRRGFSFMYTLSNQDFGIYRGSHIGSQEDFIRVNVDQPYYLRPFSYEIGNPRQEVQHHLAQLSYYQRFQNDAKLTATYGFQYNHRKEYDIRRGDLRDVAALNLELMTHQANILYQLQKNRWDIEGGLGGSYENNYSTTATMARKLIPNYDRFTGNAFGVVKRNLSNALQVEAGLRADYSRTLAKMWYDLNVWDENYAADFRDFYVRTEDGNRVFTKPDMGFFGWSANLGLNYRQGGNKFALNLTRAVRNPNAAELFSSGLHHSAAIVEEGSLFLKNEVAYQANAMIDLKAAVLSGAELHLNPYFTYSDSFINQVPTGVQSTIRGTFPVWSYQQVAARMFGLDVDASLKFVPMLQWKGSLSLLRGDDLTHDVPLILMMPANFRNELSWGNDHWGVAVSQRTVLAQKRFPVYNPVATVVVDGVATEKTVDLSTPPAGYTLLGASAFWQIHPRFRITAEADNILDTPYRDYLNRLRYFSYDLGRNLRFTLRYTF